MSGVFSLLFGLLFGIGLIFSGMTNPAKVQAFLDLAGHWDPSLAFVMAGAIGAALLPFAWAKRHQQSLLGLPMQLPQRRDIDRPLVMGSFLFGIGWGLAGVCPGPAIVNLGAGELQILWFVIPMVLSMFIYQRLSAKA